MSNPTSLKRSLPRLDPAAYKGRVSVFWTHTIEDRKKGWLYPEFHFRFRELLCHTLTRHGLICPVYCLMPDHIHLLATGISEKSDQIQYTRLIRQELNRLLLPFQLQRQAHDHVLRKDETDREAFTSFVHYTLENPARERLSESWQKYPFLGCLVPGYFNFDPRQDNFWDLYWKIHNKLVERRP